MVKTRRRRSRIAHFEVAIETPYMMDHAMKACDFGEYHALCTALGTDLSGHVGTIVKLIALLPGTHSGGNTGDHWI